jgi:hypothetical protein
MLLHHLPLAVTASLMAFSYSLKALELADIDLLDDVTDSISDVTQEVDEGINSLFDLGLEGLSLGDFQGLTTILGEPEPQADGEFDDEDLTEPDMIESEDTFGSSLLEADRPLSFTNDSSP